MSLKLLVLFALCDLAVAKKPLLSFYDFDPAGYKDKLPGLVDFGIDPPVDCLLRGYYEFGIPGLLRLGRYNLTWGDCWDGPNSTSGLTVHGLPQSKIFAMKGLFPDWKANVALTVEMIKPLMAAGAIKGVFLGDEQICGGHQTVDELGQVAQELRDLLPAGAILYTNECGCPSYPIPSALDYFGVDIYGTGVDEVKKVKECYEKSIFPNLQGNTKTFVVPGIFGNPSGNVSAIEDALVEKMEAYGAWLATEPRIAGINPWHFSTRSNRNYKPGTYPFGLGLIDFPKVLEALKKIMTSDDAVAQEAEPLVV